MIINPQFNKIILKSKISHSINIWKLKEKTVPLHTWSIVVNSNLLYLKSATDHFVKVLYSLWALWSKTYISCFKLNYNIMLYAIAWYKSRSVVSLDCLIIFVFIGPHFLERWLCCACGRAYNICSTGLIVVIHLLLLYKRPCILYFIFIFFIANHKTEMSGLKHTKP